MKNGNLCEKIERRNKRVPLEMVVPLKSPYIMHIDPCGACNFQCKFCPCNISDYRKSDRHSQMPFELYKKIIDDMKRFEEKVKVVNLYAFGEPLLNAALIKMIQYLKAQNVCDEIRITSNGYCLSPALNQELADSGLDLFRISVEALTAEDYEKLCGVKIDMEQYIQNIVDLYEKSRGGGEKIAAKIVNSMLRDEADERLFFETYGKCTDYIFKENVDDIWSEFEIGDISYNEKLRWKRDTSIKCVQGGEKCAYPLISMVIHSNGLVSACCVDWKFATVYGDAKIDSVYDLWHSDALRRFQIAHMEHGRMSNSFCSTCTFRCIDKIDDVADVIAQKLRGS